MPNPTRRPSKELMYARSLLHDMVDQHCGDSGDSGKLFSGFISVNAEVMVYLGDCGLIKITNDNGGRIVEGKTHAR